MLIILTHSLCGALGAANLRPDKTGHLRGRKTKSWRKMPKIVPNETHLPSCWAKSSDVEKSPHKKCPSRATSVSDENAQNCSSPGGWQAPFSRGGSGGAPLATVSRGRRAGESRELKGERTHDAFGAQHDHWLNRDSRATPASYSGAGIPHQRERPPSVAGSAQCAYNNAARRRSLRANQRSGSGS